MIPPRHIVAGGREALDALIEATIREVAPGVSAADLARYRDDFAAWCDEVPGIEPEEYQEQIGRSVAESRTTLVPSCNGAGKSYIAALIIVWWVMTRDDP